MRDTCRQYTCGMSSPCLSRHTSCTRSRRRPVPDTSPGHAAATTTLVAKGAHRSTAPTLASKPRCDHNRWRRKGRRKTKQSHIGDPPAALTACAESLRENNCFVPISTCMIALCFLCLGLGVHGHWKTKIQGCFRTHIHLFGATIARHGRKSLCAVD